MSANIRYREISEEIFEEEVILSKTSAILFFGASWSGNAEIMDSMMERISMEFNHSIRFFKVDIEKEKEISQFLGVSSVPTTVLFKQGEVVDLIKGFIPAKKMRAKIKTIYSFN